MGLFYLNRDEILYNIRELQKVHKKIVLDKENKFGFYSEERRAAFAAFDAISMLRLKVDDTYSQDEFKIDLFGE